MEKKRKYYLKEILDVVWPYLLLTVILLVLFAAGLVIGYGILSKHAEKTAEERLSELSGDIYDRVVCYTKICDVLAANDAVISFSQIEPGDEAEYRTAVAYLQQELSDVMEITDAPISSIEFFYPAKQTIISMDSAFKGEAQCAARFESQFDGVVTPQVLRGIPADNFWAIFYGADNGWIVRHLYDKNGPEAYVILEYKLDQLIPISDAEGVVLIGDDDAITYSSREHVTPEAYQRIRKAFQQGRRVRYDGETYIVSRCVFSMMRKDIMMAVSVNQIVSEMASFRWLLLGLVAVCVVSLAVIYWVLFQRIVLPYRYLAEAAVVKDSQASFRDVLSTARTNLLSLKSQQEAAAEERKFLIHLGVGELLQQLYHTPEDYVGQIANRCLSLSGIRPGQRYFIFAIFHMDDQKRVFERMRKERKQVTPMFVLDNLMKDLLFSNRVGMIATVRRCYYVISTCLESDTEEALGKIISRLALFYRDNYSVTVATTRPLIGAGAEDLQPLVQKTMDDVAYLDFWHQEQIGETQAWERESFTFYFKAMRNLINRLDLQDYPGAQVIFNQILEKELPRGVHELQATRYRIYGMIEMLIAAISEQAELGEEAIKQLDYERRLYSVDNINAFRQETEKIFMELIGLRQQCDVEDGGAKRIEKIRAYIDDHYTDNSLTVTSVAEQFAISAPYLSREFKRIVGCNMLDYIQKLRVGLVKKLLAETSVKDAALKAGFWDTQGLVRVFKKYEGITPGEYKKMMEEK